MPLSEQHRITIRRILKVNHAGEYGAIRIYRAQLSVSKRLHQELAPFLSETLSHEIRHCREFTEAMPPRDGRPCRLMWLWGSGGYALGFLTALMGKKAIMICTAAVERTVHEHLNDQLTFLKGKDDELHALIADIQIEENQHLGYAEERTGTLGKLLEKFIVISTETVIWLSTQGDVSRMKREIRVDA